MTHLICTFFKNTFHTAEIKCLGLVSKEIPGYMSIDICLSALKLLTKKSWHLNHQNMRAESCLFHLQPSLSFFPQRRKDDIAGSDKVAVTCSRANSIPPPCMPYEDFNLAARSPLQQDGWTTV